jgi:hypothetical protein
VAAGGAAEVDDCRWTPCYECGVCPAMGTEIQTSPMGQPGIRQLPLVDVGPGAGVRAAAAAAVPAADQARS